MAISGDALAVEMVEIHRFLVVTWARATQQRQAQAKSPLSVQIRRKWPEIEKLGLQCSGEGQMVVFCFYCSGMANVRSDRRDCRKCVVDEYGLAGNGF